MSFFLCIILYAQEIKKGRVVDAETGSGIKNANITFIKNSAVSGGTNTDSLGYFVIDNGCDFFKVSHVLYKNERFTKGQDVIKLFKNNERLISPDPFVFNLDEIKNLIKKAEMIDSLKKINSEITGGDDFFAFAVIESYPEIPNLNCFLAKNLFETFVSAKISPFGNLTVFFTVDVNGTVIVTSFDKEIDPDLKSLLTKVFNSIEFAKPATQCGEKLEMKNCSYKLIYTN
ncbi:MAG: hypothetical protein A2W91_00615 [Bacteroidetes bacterium GWF2_38_335]|nr:MAG: hypothetical protein A2W91_00615 [Bacteroidetes bacterium GWF2_38_335]OFY78335.1 MAG: hypothetical protein A2281_03995 [Bacteroidetes bacterium RIFOXYA12_FULL_38_20]HBS87469.1 hypothetical protein [Bacteroidales bacterium]